MPINFRPKRNKIVGQAKAFYKQVIPRISSARKETVDIYL